jgi:protein-tyrosine phosphatase
VSPRDWYGIGGGAVRPGRPGCSEILPWLVVGEYPNYDDLSWLRDAHAVTAVLSLQCDADLASKRLRAADVEAACAAAGLAYARVACPDGDLELLTARLPELVERLRVLRDAGDRVYLHCNAGMNRAPTVAIAAVHVLDAVPLPEAVAFVKARRLAVPYLRALEACYGRASSA